MKFAFLVHPLSEESRAMIAIDGLGGLRQIWGNDLFRFCQHLHSSVTQYHQVAQSTSRKQQIAVIDEYPQLISANGSQCSGRLYEIPMEGTEILTSPNRALEFIEQAVDDATCWGAQIIGLGAMTGIIGSRGQYLADKKDVAITTGNSLTVYSARENVLRACHAAGIDLANERVAVVGIPGSIGSAVAKLLGSVTKSLTLVSRSENRRAQQLANSLSAGLTCDIQGAVSQATVIVTATTTGSCLEQNWLRPGALVIDVAVPTDVVGNKQHRNDVLILTGGMARIPECMSRESMFFGFNLGVIGSCFAETIVLALENRPENYSIGRDLNVGGVLEIGQLAERHGFDFSNLLSFGVELHDDQLSRFQKVVYRSRQLDQPSRQDSGTFCNDKIFENAGPLENAENLHARHINPVLIALSKNNGFVKTFERAEDCSLWDSQGREYVDFVSGFGSVNLGHNHPAVANSIRAALDNKVPGFAQASVNPLASKLASRLVACTPDGLDMVSYGSSGAEAVESAIKLARAVSERTEILYCERSYHGKTLGALSVSGNPKIRTPFGPLLAGVRSVQFGDSQQLQRALETRQYAAFILEPIQCEGGMFVAPEGYLEEVEAMCRQTETLFILDEIQTGFGRTGDLFYADVAQLRPDIMTVAKSLSGGMIPCAAMLCNRELWMGAYGSVDNFMLHTSTFAGGSVAMAAGLATLDVLEQTNVLENCRQRSRQLLGGLNRIAESTDVIREVRGIGLLIGIEFEVIPENIVQHHIASDTSGLNRYLFPGAANAIRNIAPIFAMQTMLDEYGIYSQVARSHPRVLRVQPPLTISESQIDQFIEAIDVCCRELTFTNRIADAMIAKSGTGDNAKNKGEVQIS